MPSIDFPTSPAVNDTYTYGGRTWKWNGEGWQAVVSSDWVTALAAKVGTTGDETIAGLKTFTDGIAWAPLGNVTKSGMWVGGWRGTLIANALNEGNFLGAYYPVYTTHTLDRIGIEITTSGSAGSVIRLGIYKFAANNADITRVLDAGTIDGTQVAGFYSIVISQALTPGLYLIGGAQQGAPATKATLRAWASQVGGGHLFATNSHANMSQTPAAATIAATGALPAGPSTVGLTVWAPLVSVRIA